MTATRARSAILFVCVVAAAACSSAPAEVPTPTAVTTPVVSPSATAAPVPVTTTVATTTSQPIPTEVIHVFPIDPASAATYGPGGHSYEATDIFAAEGAAFVAVASGVIEGVSLIDTWDPDVDDPAHRAGLFVSLIGDDGVRYYGSHLSAVADGIEAGVRVDAGQLLGLVGRSGNARDTPPHVHFGISRPTFLDDWEVRRGEVDPVPFLDAWRRGDRAATPSV